MFKTKVNCSLNIRQHINYTESHFKLSIYNFSIILYYSALILFLIRNCCTFAVLRISKCWVVKAAPTDCCRSPRQAFWTKSRRGRRNELQLPQEPRISSISSSFGGSVGT